MGVPDEGPSGWAQHAVAGRRAIAVAKLLGLKQRDVEVVNRRMRGGFGGKLTARPSGRGRRWQRTRRAGWPG